jgi:hypothetical protein
MARLGPVSRDRRGAWRRRRLLRTGATAPSDLSSSYVDSIGGRGGGLRRGVRPLRRRVAVAARVEMDVVIPRCASRVSQVMCMPRTLRMGNCSFLTLWPAMGVVTRSSRPCRPSSSSHCISSALKVEYRSSSFSRVIASCWILTRTVELLTQSLDREVSECLYLHVQAYISHCGKVKMFERSWFHIASLPVGGKEVSEVYQRHSLILERQVV